MSKPHVSFLDSEGNYDFPEYSVKLKSILSARKLSQSQWIFARKKKRVKFAELEVKLQNIRVTETREKWRKYVAEQFKVLRDEKQTQDRWLGRGGKGKQKPRTQFPDNSSFSANDSGVSSGVTESQGLDDIFSSQDQLQTFEIPEPGDQLCPKFGPFQSMPKRF